MARSFRSSRFGRHSDIGEDVNPSAYIVNLADCMLVLACGFLVALISYWNLDYSTVEVDESDLEQVEAQDMEEDLLGGGSYYVEAGTAYRDPNTGIVYILQDGSQPSLDASEDSEESTDAGSASTGVNARALGAD